MIKINLLENSKGKSKRGGGGGPSMPIDGNGGHGFAQAESPGGGGDSPGSSILATGTGWTISRRHRGRMKEAERKNRELADVKARLPGAPALADNYKRRVDIIDGLSADQTGPVNLLAMLGETVNNAEAVWLSKIDDQEPR